MKHAMIFSISAAALLISGAAIAGHDNDDHDHDKVTRTLDLTGFDRIEISGVYDLDVRVGPEFSIELSGSEEEMARVESSVENGVLNLDRKERKKRWRNHDHGVDAKITMPSLLALEVSGVVDGKIDGINSESFDINISGVGDMD